MPDSYAQCGNLSSEFFVINCESIMPISVPLMPHRVSLNLIFWLSPGIYHERDLKLRRKFPAMIFHEEMHVHSMKKTGYHKMSSKIDF